MRWNRVQCLPIIFHLGRMLSTNILLCKRCKWGQRRSQRKWWLRNGARQNGKQTAHQNRVIGEVPFHMRHDVMQFSLGSMMILRCIVVMVLLASGYMLFARVHHFFPRHWHHSIHMHLFTLLRFHSFSTYFEWRFCVRGFFIFVLNSVFFFV